MTDTMTDTDYETLLTRAQSLYESEGTWWDLDPDVAWSTPESRLGKMAALYLESGWEECYHGEGRFHYNVKVRGNAVYWGYRDKLAEIQDRPGFELDRFERFAEMVNESDREVWWRFTLPDEILEISGTRVKVYSCGRSGGYVTAPPPLLTDPVSMVKLARYLAGVVKRANSRDAGEELFEQALERYERDKLQELASPRREANIL